MHLQFFHFLQSSHSVLNISSDVVIFLILLYIHWNMRFLISGFKIVTPDLVFDFLGKEVPIKVFKAFQCLSTHWVPTIFDKSSFQEHHLRLPSTTNDRRTFSPKACGKNRNSKTTVCQNLGESNIQGAKNIRNSFRPTVFCNAYCFKLQIKLRKWFPKDWVLKSLKAKCPSDCACRHSSHRAFHS